MPSVYDSAALVAVQQALRTLQLYAQSVRDAKQDGVTTQERVLLGLMATSMATNMGMTFLFLPSEVLERLPEVLARVELSLPEEPA